VATYQCLGTGPVSFLDQHQNQQEIPLSAIVFDANGVDASQWPGYSANQDLIKALLTQMVSAGLLAPNTQTPLTPGLTIQAVQSGISGNSTSVTFADPTASQGTMTITVAGTEVYPGLTPTTIGTALGTTASAATGLVYVQSVASGNPMPQTPFSGSISGSSETCAVPEAGSAGDAFTLAATDSAYTGISISIMLDSSGTTFTLTVSGSKTVKGVTVANLGTTNPFSLLVTFTVAPSAPPPASATVTLTGGATGVAATADVFW
jgi:hypothetical protein